MRKTVLMLNMLVMDTIKYHNSCRSRFVSDEHSEIIARLQAWQNVTYHMGWPPISVLR